MILAGSDADATELARFRAEAEAIARLQHPNILGVMDSGVAQVPSGGGTVDLLWFAMPFVEGHNVWERFEKEGALPWAEVVRIGVLVAGALDALPDESGTRVLLVLDDEDAARSGAGRRHSRPAEMILSRNP